MNCAWCDNFAVCFRGGSLADMVPLCAGCRRKDTRYKPKSPQAKKVIRPVPDDFTWPKRRPMGRFRHEDAARALAQDNATRDMLSELFV